MSSVPASTSFAAERYQMSSFEADAAPLRASSRCDISPEGMLAILKANTGK